MDATIEDATALLQLLESLNSIDNTQDIDLLRPDSAGSLSRQLYVTEKILRHLGSLTERFQTKTSHLRRAQARLHNDQQAIHRLPNEILSQVFVSLLPDLDSSKADAQIEAINSFNSIRRKVYSVCSRWTNVLRGTPRCWSMVHYDILHEYPSLSYLADEISRSMHAPLSIVLDVTSSKSLHVEALEETIRFLAPYLPRTERLTLMAKSTVHVLEVLSWTNVLGSLRHLRIELDRVVGQPMSTVPVSTPLLSLESFVFTSKDPIVSIVPKSLTDTKWLTKWQSIICSPNHDISWTIDYLANRQTFRHLDIHIAQPDIPEIMSRDEIASLFFPRLKVLRLRGSAVGLIAPLRADDLEVLGLRTISPTVSHLSISTWLTVPCLYPRLRSFSMFTKPEWDDILVPFIGSINTLEEVVLQCNLTERSSVSFASFLDHLQLRGRNSSISAGPSLRIHVVVQRMVGFKDFEAYTLQAIRRLVKRFAFLTVAIRPPSVFFSQLEKSMAGVSPRIVLSHTLEEHLLLSSVDV